MDKDLVIGFDIGTSSLKLVVLNISNNSIFLELNKSTQSAQVNLENRLLNEQNVDRISELVKELFESIPYDIKSRLRAIQLCGQMHGIVLWNKISNQHSNLVTWQDARCTPEFLAGLPVKSISDLNTGYGCATLFWFAKDEYYKINRILDSYNAAGTVHDYITYLLSKKENSMSDHNALSWGFFDLNSMKWQTDLSDSDDFPFRLLPSVCKPGTLISNSITFHGDITNQIYPISIYAALGDLQCSFYSCIENEKDCVINISTSSQVCVCVEKSKFELIKSKLPKSVTLFPFLNDKILLVAASLNGGNVLDNFVNMIIEWNIELDLFNQEITNEETKNKIWQKLIDLSSNFLKKIDKNSSMELICDPTLFGERHDKTKFASIRNIYNGNISLGELFASVCKGLIKNLHQMFPSDLLINELGCERIIATGSALLRNPILKNYLEIEFNELEIKYKASSDAAIGAAYFLRDQFYNQQNLKI